MNTSPIANELLSTIQRYIEESSRPIYRFEYEEQIKLQNAINQLNRHIDLLIDYEVKKRIAKQENNEAGE